MWRGGVGAAYLLPALSLAGASLAVGPAVGRGKVQRNLGRRPRWLHSCAVPAASFANHFGAKLVLLHVLPTVPIPEGFHWSSTGDLMQMRDKARMASQSRLEELTIQSAAMATKPEFMVEFGTASEQILLASHTLKADLIILGLNRPAHIDTASHTPWAVVYKVVCGARCPALTIRNRDRLFTRKLTGRVLSLAIYPITACIRRIVTVRLTLRGS